MYRDRTAAAISTAMTPAAIGVVRMTGPDALKIAKAVFIPHAKRAREEDFPHASALVGSIVDPKTNDKIDEAVLTCFVAPRSFTGENMAEFSCHGGARVLFDVLSLLIAQGADQAGPGEFSKRAFLNGKLDLTRAEAIIDLIDAPSSYARRSAGGQVGGLLWRKISSERENVITLGADILARLEYPEEGLEEMGERESLERLCAILQRTRALEKSFQSGAAVRDGVDSAIVGRPNVGKSSLLNSLAGADRAIVTDIPGTTRDIIRERVGIGKIILNLNDTAGIRESDDAVEKIGCDLALRAMDESALVIALFDGSREVSGDDIKIIKSLDPARTVAVINKCDMELKFDEDVLISRGFEPVKISCRTGAGIEGLKNAIESRLFDLPEDTLPGEFVTNARHREALARANEALERASEALTMGFLSDLITSDLTEAADALGEITGESATEQMIDDIFSRFCVGK